MVDEVLECDRCDTLELDDFIFIREFNVIFCFECSEYFIKHSPDPDCEIQYSLYCDSMEKAKRISDLLNVTEIDPADKNHMDPFE